MSDNADAVVVDALEVQYRLAVAAADRATRHCGSAIAAARAAQAASAHAQAEANEAEAAVARMHAMLLRADQSSVSLPDEPAEEPAEDDNDDGGDDDTDGWDPAGTADATHQMRSNASAAAKVIDNMRRNIRARRS